MTDEGAVRVKRYATLALTAVIFAGLVAFTLYTEADHVPDTRFTSAFDQAERAR